MGDYDVAALAAFYGGPDGAWSPLMIGLTLAGGGWAALLLVPMLWHGRTRALATVLTVTVSAQALVVVGLKAVVGRVRPWIALGLPPPVGAPHDGSFPSGHAAGSFCAAAFLAMVLPALWPGARWRAAAVSFGALGLAALVASSRVYLGAHFPSDVLAGAALGGAIGVAGGHAFRVRLASSALTSSSPGEAGKPTP